MSKNHTIRPEAINILGNSSRAATSSQVPNIQDDSTHKQSLWERIKSCAKELWGYLDQALIYIKENIVPVAMTAAGMLNAWANFRRYTGNMRYGRCLV